MRAFHLVVLFTIAATLTPANAGDWTTRTFEHDGFAAEFSGAVAVQPMDTGKPGYERLARVTTYTQTSKDGHVGYNRYRDGEDFNFAALARRSRALLPPWTVVLPSRLLDPRRRRPRRRRTLAPVKD